MQCVYRIKVGTGPVLSYTLNDRPIVGDSIILPFPSGGSYWAVIDGYNETQDVYYAHWR